jgi:AP-3 complex subunit mu
MGSTGTSSVGLPIYVQPQFTFSETASSRFTVKIGPKQTQGKVLEDVKLTIPMPKCVSNVLPTCSYGMPNYDPVSRKVIWQVSTFAIL